MSADSDGSFLAQAQKWEAEILQERELVRHLVENIETTQRYELINYVIDEKRAFDESGDDVDLVFEPVSIDELEMFGDFVRINGEIRLVTNMHFHFGNLSFAAYRVTQDVADAVEKNIAVCKRFAS